MEKLELRESEKFALPAIENVRSESASDAAVQLFDAEKFLQRFGRPKPKGYLGRAARLTAIGLVWKYDQWGRAVPG